MLRKKMTITKKQVYQIADRMEELNLHNRRLVFLAQVYRDEKMEQAAIRLWDGKIKDIDRDVYRDGIYHMFDRLKRMYGNYLTHRLNIEGDIVVSDEFKEYLQTN